MADDARPDTDWGLCVGISDYVPESHLDPLPGARRDAERFHAWLVSESGGAVPADQCSLVLSPAPQSETGPQPVAQLIEAWFKRLFRMVMANERDGLGARVGRRLYLYFAGHGLSLGDAREAVLLAADAEPPTSCEHVAGKLWAEWFRLRRAFDDVVLVMDCCRSGLRGIHVNGPPWQQLEAGRPARHFYAFAAAHGAAAREVEIEGTRVGLFTHTLLGYLDDPARRPLTASGLKGLLYGALGGRDEPAIEVPPNPGDDFAIAPVPRAGGLEMLGVQPGGEREVLVVYDDRIAAPPPRIAPAVLLAGGAAVPRSALGVLAQSKARRLVIEADGVSAIDLTQIIGETRPVRAALYGHSRPALHDNERLPHVVAHETDSPALARTRALAALDRVSTASLQVVSQDPCARVLVWNASGELLAEGTHGVFLDGVPLGTYRMRASIGSTCWAAEHVLDGDARIDVPPLALDTAAPVAGSVRWTAADLAVLEALDRSFAVTVVHRGGERAPRVRSGDGDALVSTSAPAGSWTVMGFRAVSARIVLEVFVGARYVALSLPVRPGHRTEVYVDGAAETATVHRCPDVAIRLVPADIAVGAARTTDRARESLRLAMIQGAANPRITAADLNGDPIAALLAATVSGQGAMRATSIDSAASALGDEDADVTAWRGGNLSDPPLLASSWSQVAASGADLVSDSLADRIADRRVMLPPWLAWEQGESHQWLDAVASTMWPAWNRDPGDARTFELADAASELGVPRSFVRRHTYKVPPVERLVRHDIAAFVGASNDQLPQALAIAFVERAKCQWRELTLWFLDDGCLRRVQSNGRSSATLLRARARAEAQLLGMLPVVAHRWRVLRYGGFHIDGAWHFASLWDWQQAGGFVHLSPYRAGADVRTTMKLDIEWPSASPTATPAYATAVRAYDGLQPTAIVGESPDWSE